MARSGLLSRSPVPPLSPSPDAPCRGGVVTDSSTTSADARPNPPPNVNLNYIHLPCHHKSDVAYSSTGNFFSQLKISSLQYSCLMPSSFDITGNHVFNWLSRYSPMIVPGHVPGSPPDSGPPGSAPGVPRTVSDGVALSVREPAGSDAAPTAPPSESESGHLEVLCVGIDHI